MKTPLRILAALLIGVWVAACAGTGPADPESALRQRIGKAAGVSGFDRIDALRYTFNVQIGERRISRSWVWEPQPNRVVLKAENDGADYNRAELGSSEELRAVDARFVNDNYWLLFPLHVYWNVRASVQDAGQSALPIGSGSARRVIISYPAGVGYTPGDVYELFLDGDFKILQWIYRKGGATEPTRITTWEDYRRLGPLTVSLNHRSADGGFRLWFTDVGVKLKGEKLWTAPSAR
jgi:hypothetical protein